MARGPGTRRENELVDLFDQAGFSVIRSPSSGSRTDRDQPDVLASIAVQSDTDDGDMTPVAIAAEVKYGAPPRNLTGEEAAGLERFALDFGAVPVAAVRYKGQRSFFLVSIRDMMRTDSGNWSTDSGGDTLPWLVRLDYDSDGDLTAVTGPDNQPIAVDGRPIPGQPGTDSDDLGTVFTLVGWLRAMSRGMSGLDETPDPADWGVGP